MVNFTDPHNHKKQQENIEVFKPPSESPQQKNLGCPPSQ